MVDEVSLKQLMLLRSVVSLRLELFMVDDIIEDVLSMKLLLLLFLLSFMSFNL